MGLLNAMPRAVRDGVLGWLMRRARGALGEPPAAPPPRPLLDVHRGEEPRRVVVIGAGVGGAAAAALLAHEGHEVTLLEAREVLGGRASSGSSQGFEYDMGVHLCGQGVGGPAARVAEAVGADLRWLDEEMAFELRCGDQSRVFGRDVKDLGELAALARVIGVAPSAAPAAASALAALMFPERIEEVVALDGITVSDYLARFTTDPGVIQLLEVMCLLMLCVPADEASAGEFAWCFANLARAGRVSYPVGGVQEVPASYVRALKACGGVVRTGARAERILVEDGRVRAVEAGGRLHVADWVISNAGLRNTVALVGEEHLPADYLAQVSALRESFSAVTIKYGLDERLLPVQVVLDYDPAPRLSTCFEDRSRPTCPTRFVVSPPDPTLAPDGCQLVMAGALLAREALAGDGGRRALDLLHEHVCGLVPGLEDHLLTKVETGPSTISRISGRPTPDVVGVAQRFDQVGQRRPDAVTPVDGLFLVGCDAGGRGVGIEQAADSAWNLAQSLSGRSPSAPR